MKGKTLVITGVTVVAAIVVLGPVISSSAIAETTVAQLKAVYGSDLEVLGEVQHIDSLHGSLIVSGQHISVSRSTSFSYNGVVVSDAVDGFRMLQPGDLLAVIGQLDSPATFVLKLKDEYVPGATTIFIKGKVESIDSSLGTAKIDGITLDLTRAMADPRAPSIEPGDIAEAKGIQPSTGARLLADTIVEVSKVLPTSIIGSGKTAPSSIIGTGKAGPDSIIGTGKVGPDSIIGTGKVGPDSIIGTGKVGPDSIIGTGKVGPDSIIGTGKVGPDSIIGTGKVGPDSIIGTGRVGPDSIIGTGKVGPDSIIGTGKVGPDSINGTGKVEPDSIIGTGKLGPDSIIGTG